MPVIDLNSTGPACHAVTPIHNQGAQSFIYNPDRRRSTRTDTVRTGQGTSTTTTVYLGAVEHIIAADGASTYRRTLAGGTVLITQQHNKAGARTANDTRYLLRDHLDSVVALFDSAGAIVQHLRYDPWGQRIDPDNSELLAQLSLTSALHTRHSCCPCLTRLSSFQKQVYFDFCLLENRPQSSFRHIARMVGNSGISTSFGIEPDLMAAGSLPVKLKSSFFQFADNLPVLNPDSRPIRRQEPVGNRTNLQHVSIWLVGGAPLLLPAASLPHRGRFPVFR